MIRFRTTHPDRGACTRVAAFDGKLKVGAIGGCAGITHLEVLQVEVLDTHRRQGIATKLYEHMAKDACRRGLMLASSDFQRNRLSNAFWEKQIVKGRAQRVEGRVELINTCSTTTLAAPKKTRRVK